LPWLMHITVDCAGCTASSYPFFPEREDVRNDSTVLPNKHLAAECFGARLEALAAATASVSSNGFASVWIVWCEHSVQPAWRLSLQLADTSAAV